MVLPDGCKQGAAFKKYRQLCLKKCCLIPLLVDESDRQPSVSVWLQVSHHPLEAALGSGMQALASPSPSSRALPPPVFQQPHLTEPCCRLGVTLYL